MTRKNFTSLAIVVVAGLIFHLAIFVPLDSKNTPADAAVEFTRAYYRLSPSMADWMCGTSAENCDNCDCANKSADCPKAVSGHDPAKCPKAVSGDELADCPKVATDLEKADCQKADCQKADCPKAASGHKPADCPKAVCSKELARRANTAVENYLYEARMDAAERGFGEGFAKYTLSHVETRTEYLDDATAVVHLTAHSRLEINPIYAYVAQLFRIGDTYEVDASIRVKLEDGDWRVCMSSLSSMEMS